MKKHLKWIVPVICIVLAAAIGGGYSIIKNNRVPTEIRYTESVSLINHSDPREVVGSKKYVFVGYVEEIHDFILEKDSRDFPELIINYGDATTECVVKVIKNLKGNLIEGEAFSFYKGGGVAESREYIELSRNDFIPEVGKYYIFTGYAHECGTVTGGGENGTIELEVGIDESNFEQSEIYQKYVDAVANQIAPPIADIIMDYRAKNDVDYGDGSYNAALYEKDLIIQAELDEKFQTQLAEHEKSKTDN